MSDNSLKYYQDIPVAYAVIRVLYNTNRTEILDAEILAANDRFCRMNLLVQEENLIGSRILTILGKERSPWLGYCHGVLTSGNPHYARIYDAALGQWLGYTLAPASEPDCCAIAFMNVDEEQKTTQTNNAILRCIKELISAKDYDMAMSRTLEVISEETHPDRVNIFEANGSLVNNAFEWCAPGVAPLKDKLQKISSEAFYDWEVEIRKQGFLRLDDTMNLKDKLPVAYQELRQNGVRRFLGVPLYDEGKIIGCLCIDNYEEEYFQDYKKFLQHVSAPIAYQMVNHELVSMLDFAGNTDALTGICNRHGLDSQIQSYMREHGDEPCTLVMMDIDDFKYVNDLYGHGIGDEVLKQFAKTLEKVLPKDCLVARNGGDEFVALLKGYSAEKAGNYVQRLTDMDHAFQYDGNRYNYTISAGFAEYPTHAESISILFKRADAALYSVKLHGKNGCHVYTDSMIRQNRARLGFSLNDVASNIPGAILIYKADESEKILFANDELIKMFDCADLNDFMNFTGQSFRGIVHPEDLDKVEKSIEDQIAGADTGNDCVDYRIITKTGTVKEIIDNGRLVDTEYHGKVFYVVLVDRAPHENQRKA